MDGASLLFLLCVCFVPYIYLSVLGGTCIRGYVCRLLVKLGWEMKLCQRLNSRFV